MQERNNNHSDPHTGRSKGMQGIDKAPGEETPGAPEQFVSQTQKGKNSVDGDPSKEEDKPIDQQDID